MIISIEINAEIVFHKNLTLFHDENMKQTMNRGKFLNLIKGIYEKSTANIILNSKRPKTLFLRSGTKQGCLFSPILGSVSQGNYTKK